MRRGSTIKAILPPLVPLLLLLGCSGNEESHDEHDHEGETTAAHADEGGHADEMVHVELTEQQFGSAEVRVMAVGPGRVSETLMLPGTVSPNADAVLHVTPRVSGQVRSALKHLGQSVNEGELLCVLDSVELGEAVADYVRDRELTRAAEETLSRERELFSERLAAQKTVLDGAVDISQHIYEREKELREKEVSTVRPLLEADKAFRLAQLERDRQLTELRAERDSRLLALEVDLRTRRIGLATAANRLRSLGLDEEIIEGLDETSVLLSGEYRIHASGDGVVVRRHVSNGEFVEAGTKLYVIENLSSVWFVASVFEDHLRSVRSGQTVLVTLDAFPEATLRGVVSFVDYHVDPRSRSVGVRVTLDNEQLEDWLEELPLRPGMFGRAELETEARDAALVLPESALVHDDEGDYVFVQVEPLAFERRGVVAKHMAGGMAEVISGLEAGEMVAVSGTFLLKSTERQGDLGGGHSH